MAVKTLNISLSEEQSAMITAEVKAGRYTSASEVVREAIRHWEDKRMAADLAALEKAHGGAWERDTTPDEEAAILRAKKSARAKIRARKEAKGCAA